MELSALQTWGVTAGVLVLLLAAAVAALTWQAIRYRKLYVKVRSQEKNSGEMIDNLHEGIYRTSMEGSLIFANAAFARLNVYDNAAEMLEAAQNIGDEWYVTPERRTQFQAILEEKCGVEDFVSEIHRHKTRERIWVSESARLVRTPENGGPLYYEGSVREITETVKRLELEERFSALTNQLPGAVFQLSVDRTGNVGILFLSAAYEKICGLKIRAVIEQPELFYVGIHDEDRQRCHDTFNAASIGFARWEVECRYKTPSGDEKWLQIMATPECSGNIVLWHGYLYDISMRKRQELEIQRLAFFDALTGLPNRRALLARLGGAFAARRHDDRYGAVLYIDLDNFKALNDTQGHHIGDEYLIQVATRISNCAREDTVVARLGGDEFVVLIDRINTSREQADIIALEVGERILAGLRPEFRFGHLIHSASASIGVVVFDGSESSEHEILKRADIAMYRAKNAGRNDVALFEPATLNEAAARFALTNELRKAITDQQLDLYFQPQFDRAGKIRGAEALLRWLHPEHGVLKPAQFPLSEQPDLILDIDCLVLRKGIQTLAAWQASKSGAQIRLSLNLSARSLRAPSFIQFLRHLIEETEVDISALTLELTEQVMSKDRKPTIQHMNELKELGVRFALDNFGAGYFSLADLKNMPFGEIKIAGNFVHELETSEGDRTMVKTMLAMIRTLGLESVGEHIETDQQRIFLQLFGCTVFQGSLLGEPEPLAAFNRLLERKETETASFETVSILAPITKKAG